MYWFKNAMIYRLTKSLNLDDLQDKLNYAVFTPCQPSDSTHFGWNPPLVDVLPVVGLKPYKGDKK